MGKGKGRAHKRDYAAERLSREHRKERARESKRASESRELLGEMPYAEWDYQDVVEGIEARCKAMGLAWDRSRLDMLPRGFVKRAFLRRAGRHHIDGEPVAFYGIDQVAVFEMFSEDLSSGRKTSKGVLREAIEEEKAVSAQINCKDLDEAGAERRRAFEKKHGYSPCSVYAFMEAFPSECEFGFNTSGERVVSVPSEGGGRFVCQISEAREQALVGFDVTAERKDGDGGEEGLLAPAEIIDDNVAEDAEWHTAGIEVDVERACEILKDERMSFLREHGFPSNSVLAYRDRFPDRVRAFVSHGECRLKVMLKNSYFTCRESEAAQTTVRGFDAVRGAVRRRAMAAKTTKVNEE